MQRAKCMNCGSSDLASLLDLGAQPSGNVFPAPGETAGEPHFPMHMLVCETCWQVQIDQFPSQEELFSDHPYVTGANVPVVEHFKTLSRHMVAKLQLAPRSLVFDIGCNDGTLLEQFAEQGMRVVGFDPSLRVGQLAAARGITVCRCFWCERTGRAVHDLGLVPDLITATAVFYHVPDLHDFVRGLTAAMGERTVFAAQCVYMKDLLEKNEFDHFYHEHSCIHAVTPLQRLFAAHGMRILDVELVDVHGGSFVVYAGRESHPLPTSPGVQKTIEDERTAGLTQMSTYRDFVGRVRTNAEHLVTALRQIRARGERVYALGAPLKGSTLLNFCKIGPELVELATEVNQFKIGRVTPGTHIPIVDERTVTRPPDYYLVLSWNFLDYFVEKFHDYLAKGGKLLVPCPEVRVVSIEDGTLRQTRVGGAA